MASSKKEGEEVVKKKIAPLFISIASEYPFQDDPNRAEMIRRFVMERYDDAKDVADGYDFRTKFWTELCISLCPDFYSDVICSVCKEEKAVHNIHMAWRSTDKNTSAVYYLKHAFKSLLIHKLPDDKDGTVFAIVCERCVLLLPGHWNYPTFKVLECYSDELSYMVEMMQSHSHFEKCWSHISGAGAKEVYIRSNRQRIAALEGSSDLNITDDAWNFISKAVHAFKRIDFCCSICRDVTPMHNLRLVRIVTSYGSHTEDTEGKKIYKNSCMISYEHVARLQKKDSGSSSSVALPSYSRNDRIITCSVNRIAYLVCKMCHDPKVHGSEYQVVEANAR